MMSKRKREPTTTSPNVSKTTSPVAGLPFKLTSRSTTPISFSLLDSKRKQIPCNFHFNVPNTTSVSSDTESSPHKPILVFTHGAGGDSSIPAVQIFVEGFSKLANTCLFDGSMHLGDRVQRFHAVTGALWKQALEDGWTGSLVLGGRSLGARAAVVALTEALNANDDGNETNMINGLVTQHNHDNIIENHAKKGRAQTKGKVQIVLVSYPLFGAKSDQDNTRSQILYDLVSAAKARSIDLEVLFVFGSEDEMCPAYPLLDVWNEMKAMYDGVSGTWMVIEGATHGMEMKMSLVDKSGDREVGPHGLKEEVTEAMRRKSGGMAAEWVLGKRRQAAKFKDFVGLKWDNNRGDVVVEEFGQADGRPGDGQGIMPYRVVRPGDPDADLFDSVFIDLADEAGPELEREESKDKNVRRSGRLRKKG